MLISAKLLWIELRDEKVDHLLMNILNQDCVEICFQFLELKGDS